jgi:hypothetical protein
MRDGGFVKKNTVEVISILVPNNSELERLITQIPCPNYGEYVFQISNDGPGAHRASYAMCTRVSFPGDKESGA